MKKLFECISLIYCLFILLFGFSSIARADEYVLVMSKEDDVCQHMLKLYNADMRKYGQVRFDKHEEFDWIKWKDKKISFQAAGMRAGVTNDSLVKIALFDINNDTRDEAIIYMETWMYNHPSDQYEVLGIDDLPILDDVIDGKLYYPKIQKSFDTVTEGVNINLYDISSEGLKKLPKRVVDYIKQPKRNHFDIAIRNIRFAKLYDHYFIVFEGPRGFDPNANYKNMEHFSVISSLQQDNTLKNHCLYFIKKNKPTDRRTN